MIIRIFSKATLIKVDHIPFAGELVGMEDTVELSHDEAEEDMDGVDMSQDSAVDRLVNILMELGADKLFKE